MAHSVDVLIKAKDQASRKFGVIAGAAAVMGKALKGVARITKTAFVAAFRVAKYAVMGLSAAFAYCTYAAIKQEASVIELASALKVTGQYSEKLMKEMREQAGAIQDATVYGDEYILMLMRMALTQGVAADKAADAAKAAIALHAGFGGGRGKPEIFLRYYIDALRETGSSLDSYVGELRNAETQEERMRVLQDALARGWDVATSKTDSAGGALKQMKNKLGDVAETIAAPFLPAIASSAHAITQWAKENEDNIAWWAEKTHSSVTFIKDVFMDFVDYMKKDWRAGLAFVLDSFLKLLKATFEAAVLLAIAGGKGIWRGVKLGIFGGTGANIHKLTEARYWKERTGPPMTAAEAAAYEATPLRKRPFYQKIYKEIEKEILAKQTKSILGETVSAITDTFSEAFTSILKDMPEDLRKKVNEAWEIHLERLKAIGEAPGRKPFIPGAGAGAPAPFAWKEMLESITSNIKRRLAPMEARFLTFAPGTRFNRTEKNTGDTAKNTSQATRLIKAGNKKLEDIKVILGTPGPRLSISNFA